jgi:hypothetical protein
MSGTYDFDHSGAPIYGENFNGPHYYSYPSHAGLVTFNYNAYTVGDGFHVTGEADQYTQYTYFNDVVIGSGSVTFCKNEGVTEITVTVIQNLSYFTGWDYQLSCVEPVACITDVFTPLPTPTPHVRTDPTPGVGWIGSQWAPCLWYTDVFRDWGDDYGLVVHGGPQDTLEVIDVSPKKGWFQVDYYETPLQFMNHGPTGANWDMIIEGEYADGSKVFYLRYGAQPMSGSGQPFSVALNGTIEKRLAQPIKFCKDEGIIKINIFHGANPTLNTNGENLFDLDYWYGCVEPADCTPGEIANSYSLIDLFNI